jgi:hypothetical protein
MAPVASTNQQAITIRVCFPQIPPKILDADLRMSTLDWVHGMEQLQIGFRQRPCGNVRSSEQGQMPE